MTDKKLTRKDILGRARRVVVKIGSTVVASRTSGVNQKRIAAISDELAWLMETGREVVVVNPRPCTIETPIVWK